MALKNITTPADPSLDTLATHTGGNWEITAKMHGKVFQLRHQEKKNTKKKSGLKMDDLNLLRGALHSFLKNKSENKTKKKVPPYITKKEEEIL